MLGLGYVGLGIGEPFANATAPTVQPTPPIEMPNPRGRQFPTDLYSWIENTDLNLLGKDVFFGHGGPNYDYPNPRGYIPGIDLKTWTQNTPLNLIGQDKQFRGPGQGTGYEYPNPNWVRKRAYNANTFTQQSLALSTFKPTFGLGGFPNFDQPNPRGYRRAIDLISSISPITDRASDLPRYTVIGVLGGSGVVSGLCFG